MKSFMLGNYTLCQVLPKIYEVTSDYLHKNTLFFVAIIPLCEITEQLSLLQLLALMANKKPSVSLII